MQSLITLLWRYLRPLRGWVALLMLVLLGGIALQIAIPQITRTIIDEARQGAELRVLHIAALGFIALALTGQIAGIASTYLGEWVAWTATNRLRADLAAHCMHLDMSFHNQMTPGELVERIDGDVLQVSAFFSSLVINVVGNLLLVAGIIGVLLLEDWRIGGALAGFAAFTIWVLHRLRNVAVPAFKAFRAQQANLFSTLEEHLAAREDLQANGAYSYLFDTAQKNQHDVEKANLHSQMRSMILGVVAGLTLTLGFAIAFTLGYTLFQAGTITIGVAYLIMNYTILLTNPLRQLSFQIEKFQRIQANIQRISELMAVSNRLTLDGTREPEAGALSLRFENVGFGYDETMPVLQDISFSLPAGQVLGVLGRTGSGKTTLTRLIMRFYDPLQGRVLLDGVDLREMDLASLRRHVGMVTQDVQLFRASVRDNLTFFDDTITDMRIREVLATLELESWLDSLPNGLETILKGDAELSGGQAQLLAFARVFLHDPTLVILDEAVSRLDPTTERRIQAATEALLQGRTVVIIAHRLATITHADYLLLLTDGQIVEQGTPAALRDQPDSYFNQLIQTATGEVFT